MSYAKALDWQSLSPTYPGSFESVDDAMGVLRDAVAAFSNVDTLLRSPKIGGRALMAVLPGLREQRKPVSQALAYIAAQLRAHEEARPALEELLAFVAVARGRFAHAVDRATLGGLHTARERLAFEGEASRILPDFHAASDLLRLLLVSVSGKPTDIDLREVIEQAFVSSQRRGALRLPIVSAVVALPDTPCSLHASPAVVMPLITLAVALVHRKTGDKPSLFADCASDGSLALVISDRPAEGDCLSLHPAEIILPAISCAQTAARLSGGSMEIAPDHREIVLRWPA